MLKGELHLLAHPCLYNGALKVDFKGLLRGFNERIQCSKRTSHTRCTSVLTLSSLFLLSSLCWD